jgi:hypothetical protein
LSAIALSSDTRGAVWDLRTGQQLLQVRGFRNIWMTEGNGAIADFPKLDTLSHAIGRMDLPSRQITNGIPLNEGDSADPNKDPSAPPQWTVRQQGRFPSYMEAGRARCGVAGRESRGTGRGVGASALAASLR